MQFSNIIHYNIMKQNRNNNDKVCKNNEKTVKIMIIIMIMISQKGSKQVRMDSWLLKLLSRE